MELPPGFPWPAGTLTTGVDYTFPWPEGIPVRSSCRQHIFETLADPISVDYGCGWVQAARCLICCYNTPPIDATFWMKRADPFDIAGAFGDIAASIEHLESVRTRLEQGWMDSDPAKQPTGMVLQDFDAWTPEPVAPVPPPAPVALRDFG